MKIRTRLLLAFGSIMFLVAILFSIIFVLSNDIRHNAELAKDESILFDGYAQEMKRDIIQVQQWISDISATRALDGLDDGFTEAEKNKESFLEKAAHFKAMYTRENDPQSLRNIKQIEEAMEAYYKQGVKMAQAYIDEGPSGGNKLMGAFDAAAEKLSGLAEPFVAQQANELNAEMVATIADIKNLILSTVIGGLLLLTLAIVATIHLTRAIVNPIDRTVYMIQEMGQGHLSARLNLGRMDEIGLLADTMDKFADGLQNETVQALTMLANGDLTFEATPKDERDAIGNALKKTGKDLNKLVVEINTAAEQISVGSNQVSDSSQILAQGASEQASSLEEISSAMTEMASQTKMTADNAREAEKLSSTASAAAEAGNEQMQQMVEAMDEIRSAGQSVANVIKVIDEIAFQTNMLALNAAVEAAHAGQHGKGFAVVAEEVRNLAARSAKAAKETEELIAGSVSKTENGAAIADQTATALEEIMAGVSQTSELVASIAEASQEQSLGITQVTQGLEQIDQVTQQNSASAEEGAAAAEELSGQAAQLRQMLQKFKLERHNEENADAPRMSQLTWDMEDSAEPQKPQLTDASPGLNQSLDSQEFGRY